MSVVNQRGEYARRSFDDIQYKAPSHQPDLIHSADADIHYITHASVGRVILAFWLFIDIRPSQDKCKPNMMESVYFAMRSEDDLDLRCSAVKKKNNKNPPEDADDG